MFNVFPLPRNVYILGDGLLFDDIIAHMLTPEPHLRVIKRSCIDETVFLTDVSKYNPHVILLNESARFNCEQLVTLLSRMPLTTDRRIITMSLKHENIHILDQSAGRIAARSAVLHIIPGIKDRNELLDLVRGRPLGRVISQ